MANRELIIDDEYCAAMGEYFALQGNRMDQIIEIYMQFLRVTREKAIVGGEVADALSTYIQYVTRLTDRFGVMSRGIQTQVSNFLEAVDHADQYLF